ncbi:hypothetical protein [Paenibacillus sp. RC343]|uniref:hypothetical protein n=2 Tax=unclassified Paenibacillus TaxID=185978 RepID=UPI0024BAA4BD|nr:hypothetical protein [Paenibacillus sp. RC343]
MKHKTGLLSLVVVGLLALSQGSVSAASAAEIAVMDYTPLKIDSNITVKKFSDGRVEPIENAKSLTEKQQYEILSEMDYTGKDIKKLSETEKVFLITEGGAKVNLNQSEMVHKYFDLSGKEQHHSFRASVIRSANVLAFFYIILAESLDLMQFLLHMKKQVEGYTFHFVEVCCHGEVLIHWVSGN